MKIRSSWISLFFFLLGSPLQAQSLLLSEVLDSTRTQHPDVKVFEQKLAAVEGKVFSSLGGFDPYLKSKYYSKESDAYPNRRFDLEVRQPTPYWGIEVFAGYALGRGTFALYEEDLKTLSNGELRIGAEVPLLQNSWTDQRRFDLFSARNQNEQADDQLKMTKLMLTEEAAVAYFEWSMFHQKVQIRKKILEIAESRRKALEVRSESGDLARIAQVDNERLVTKRKIDLAKATRKFQEAGVKLSLYFRDQSGEPIVPDSSKTPEGVLDWAKNWEDYLKSDRKGDGLPSIDAMKKEVDRLESQVSLAKNQTFPKLSLFVSNESDLGSGFTDLPQHELKGGIIFEMPLLLRKPRGALATARANVIATESKVALMRNKQSVMRQVAEIHARQSGLAMELAEKEFELSSTLEDAERKIFFAGGTDLIKVNIREETTAAAAFKVAENRLEVLRALVSFWTSTGILRVEDEFSSVQKGT